MCHMIMLEKGEDVGERSIAVPAKDVSRFPDIGSILSPACTESACVVLAVNVLFYGDATIEPSVAQIAFPYSILWVDEVI